MMSLFILHNVKQGTKIYQDMRFSMSRDQLQTVYLYLQLFGETAF